MIDSGLAINVAGPPVENLVRNRTYHDYLANSHHVKQVGSRSRAEVVNPHHPPPGGFRRLFDVPEYTAIVAFPQTVASLLESSTRAQD